MKITYKPCILIVDVVDKKSRAEHFCVTFGLSNNLSDNFCECVLHCICGHLPSKLVRRKGLMEKKVGSPSTIFWLIAGGSTDIMLWKVKSENTDPSRDSNLAARHSEVARKPDTFQSICSFSEEK